MSTDLGEIVRERLAEKVRNGQRWTKADLEQLAAVTDAVPFSSVAKSRSVAKGETGIDVKTYHRDPFEAERINDEIFARQRSKFPMLDGTVGSPMVEPKAKK